MVAFALALVATSLDVLVWRTLRRDWRWREQVDVLDASPLQPSAQEWRLNIFQEGGARLYDWSNVAAGYGAVVHAMQREGLLELDRSAGDSGDTAHVYRLTPEGRAAAPRQVSAWELYELEPFRGEPH